MAAFILSGFADEIDPSMDVQIRALKKLGIRYVELRGVDGRNITSLTEEETVRLKEKLDAASRGVSAIGSPLGKISIYDDFAPHLALFDHVVRQAQILGTRYIRLFSFYDAFDEREEVLRRLGLFLDHTPKGIVLLHENEKAIYGNTAEHCLDLMHYFEGAPFRATFDPANLIQEHGEVLEGFDMLAPYIDYIHVKDALMKDGSVVPSGQGDADWPSLLDRLRRMDFQGFTSIEPHLTDFTGFAALEKDADTAGKEDQGKGEALFGLAAASFRAMLLKGEEQ